MLLVLVVGPEGVGAGSVTSYWVGVAGGSGRIPLRESAANELRDWGAGKDASRELVKICKP